MIASSAVVNSRYTFTLPFYTRNRHILLTHNNRSQPSARIFPVYNIAAADVEVLWVVHEEAEATAAHEVEVDTEEVAAVEVDSVHRGDINHAEGKFSHLAYKLSTWDRKR